MGYVDVIISGSGLPGVDCLILKGVHYLPDAGKAVFKSPELKKYLLEIKGEMEQRLDGGFDYARGMVIHFDEESSRPMLFTDNEKLRREFKSGILVGSFYHFQVIPIAFGENGNVTH